MFGVRRAHPTLSRSPTLNTPYSNMIHRNPESESESDSESDTLAWQSDGPSFAEWYCGRGPTSCLADVAFQGRVKVLMRGASPRLASPRLASPRLTSTRLCTRAGPSADFLWDSVHAQLKYMESDWSCQYRRAAEAVAAMARAPACTPPEQLVKIGVQGVQRELRALLRACDIPGYSAQARAGMLEPCGCSVVFIPCLK